MLHRRFIGDLFVVTSYDCFNTEVCIVIFLLPSMILLISIFLFFSKLILFTLSQNQFLVSFTPFCYFIVFYIIYCCSTFYYLLPSIYFVIYFAPLISLSDRLTYGFELIFLLDVHLNCDNQSGKEDMIKTF